MASYKHRMVEEALNDLPRINMEYQSMKSLLDLKALAGGCMYDERVDGGSGLSKADRYLDRYNNPSLAALKQLSEAIYGAYNELSSEQKRTVALRYWQKLNVCDIAMELKFSERSVYRCINSALYKLYKPILEIESLLEDWRIGAIK